jgi:hypothetical protein
MDTDLHHHTRGWRTMGFDSAVKVAENSRLIPVFDPRLRTFSVQLWQDGEPCGIHGLTDNFQRASEPLEAIDVFLASSGVRALTEEEAQLLLDGLGRAENGR